MKKLLALILTVMVVFSSSIVATAVDYDQVFESGTLGSKTFRIPALYTIDDGSVIAVADMRYEHGSDSPSNIEIVVAKSTNGYTDWSYQILNRFDDYADGVTDSSNASFIDSAIVQSSSGRIFIISDAQPSGCGYAQSKSGTGFVKIGEKKYLLLTSGNNGDSLDSFEYYIGDYEGEYAPVLTVDDSDLTNYSVDTEFNLYKDGKPLYMLQKGSKDVQIRQNVYYNDAELCCYKTTYLWMRYSDDNGNTWSSPVNLSAQVKKSSEGFFGICPGRGFVTEYNGKERIIFTVYDDYGIAENVSTIYSDDNGVTWYRGDETIPKLVIGKTSESQIVELNNGVLRMFARNAHDYVAYADSTDGGVSWAEFTADLDLAANGNCMSSFINTSKTINGKKVILGSFASNKQERADGVVKVGLVNGDNTIDWISTYNVNSGFYAYSCLTELDDGNFGLLYEDELSHISYIILKLNDDGTISEVNDNNAEIENNQTFWEKIVNFFKEIIVKLQLFFGMF